MLCLFMAYSFKERFNYNLLILYQVFTYLSRHFFCVDGFQLSVHGWKNDSGVSSQESEFRIQNSESRSQNEQICEDV
jgi:hypothetical protein